MLLTLLVSLSLVLVASRIHKFLSGLKVGLDTSLNAWYTPTASQSVGYLPGLRAPFSPLSLFGAILPTRWWNPGLNWSWEWRKTAFFDHTYDVISMVPFLLGTPCYYTGSLEVIKQLLGNEGKTHLIKPRELTSALLLWGDNLVSANDEMWKRHRRIVAPAFTAKTYSLVCKESIATYKEMVSAEGWDQQHSVLLPEINSFSIKFALIIISRCGFGLPMPWVESSRSVGRTLTVVSETAIPRLIIPRWLYSLPIQKLHDIEHAWVALSTFMHDLLTRKKQEMANQADGDEDHQGDIFSRLVGAYDENAKFGLEEQEVIGNTFTLMFAGHETTANVLAATLGYLAIHQAEQEEAYQEIEKAIPRDRDPCLEDMANLGHLYACFLEALRLFPAGVMLTRDMTEDVTIRVTHPTEKTMVLKKGTRMIVDMIAVHHNPRTFPDPEKFKPSRWHGVSEPALSMFGLGPRACIGRKFAQTEALCFLSLFLRDWKCDIVLREGETREQYEDRVMTRGGRVGLAFGVGPVPLNLTRRK